MEEICTCFANVPRTFESAWHVIPRIGGRTPGLVDRLVIYLLIPPPLLNSPELGEATNWKYPKPRDKNR